jgi:FAD/FMN-containing dehydrogenase/Fe-S oxidoreductase
VDERRARIHDDLRGMLKGELLFHPLERAPYALDASLYEIEPLGVVVPRTEADVVTVVRYAAEHAIPIHARGGGSGQAGGALGSGLIIDFSRHFRRVVAVNSDSVVVQPGMVLDVLNAQLAPLGRRIGPDPSGSNSATIGGLIAQNAAGPRSLRWGPFREHVLQLRVVFANSETAVLEREPWPAFGDEPADFKGLVVRKLGALVRRNAETISRRAAKVGWESAGYPLGETSTASGIDLAKFLAGSEGTLALFTEATLRTVPIPSAQAVMLLPFTSIIDAAAAVVPCLEHEPSLCDLFDWRTLRLVRDALPQFREWVPEAAESALVVEFEGDSHGSVHDRATTLSAILSRSGLLAGHPVVVTRRVECEALLGLRESAEPLLMRMRGRARPVPFLEGLSVPPQALPEFLQRLQNILKQFDVSWTLDAYAGLGRLHMRPLLDLADLVDAAKLEPLAAQVFDAALDAGGAIAAENGYGLVRTQFVRKQIAELFQVAREVKDAFDPMNLLNPGIIIGDDPHLMTRNLRRLASPRPVAPEPVPEGGMGESLVLGLPILRWPESSPVEHASVCNGCGACRSFEPSLRMCPMFRALRTEAASPRSKANLVRQIAAGSIDPKLWGTEEFKANADLCVHCNLCESECPSGLDVSRLMLEAKAAYVENHGLAPRDWLLSRVEFWSRLASRFPIVSNALLASGTARWTFERLFGLSRLRRLPRVRRTPFVRRAARLGLTKARPHAPGPRVAYFVDVYANYFDQELAEAVVAVLHHANVNVFVPAKQQGSGMPALVAGDIDLARDLALRNLRILGNAVRDGYTIVCSEPTAAMMIRHEYLKLTDDLDAALVAENTRELCHYLAGLEARGQLPQPQEPIHARAGYHQPCHLRSLGVGTPGLDLIRKIPELDVEFIDRGCSGMAGTFGLARGNFRTSLRAGRGLLSRLRDPEFELGATECGACRIQMEQGVTKRTLHPVKLLSLSYGLNPALRRQFKDPKPRHVISS